MEDLSSKLAKFGFSPNQAKTYLAIAYSDCTTIRQISETTNIHPQDIYKIIKELQKKGIVQRTLNKPIKVEATPIEKVLTLALCFEKQKFEKRLEDLNQVCREIEKTFDTKTQTTTDTKDPKIFVLQTEGTDTALGKIGVAFENMNKEYDALISLYDHKWEKRDATHETAVEITRQGLSKQGIKIRWLVLTNNNKADFARIFEDIKEVSSPEGNCEFKTLQRKEPFSFAILDFKEVWIQLCSGKDNAKASNLVTDNKLIVALAKHSFETLWNDPKAKTILLN